MALGYSNNILGGFSSVSKTVRHRIHPSLIEGPVSHPLGLNTVELRISGGLQERQIPPQAPFTKGGAVRKSPFSKGGFRGILLNSTALPLGLVQK